MKGLWAKLCNRKFNTASTLELNSTPYSLYHITKFWRWKIFTKDMAPDMSKYTRNTFKLIFHVLSEIYSLPPKGLVVENWCNSILTSLLRTASSNSCGLLVAPAITNTCVKTMSFVSSLRGLGRGKLTEEGRHGTNHTDNINGFIHLTEGEWCRRANR